MKFLAWVMLLSITACFISTFCRQQWEREIADATAMPQSAMTWDAAVAASTNDETEDSVAEVAPVAGAPTSRPAIASVVDPAPPPAAIAAGDLSDAVK